MRAASGGCREDTVRYLLTQDVRFNAADDYGLTPFLHAVIADSKGVLRIFVEEKDLVRKEDEIAGEGLRTAALKDKRDALKYLLMLGVDINSADPVDGNTALYLAAGEGNEARLKCSSNIRRI